MNSPAVSVLMVSFNTKELTADALQSILDTTATDIEIMVWDNNSTDGSAEMISQRFPQVHLVPSRKNIGFGAANNRLAEMANGEWILLLNPDTKLVSNAIDNVLAQAHKEPKYRIWGGRTVFADGSPNLSSCWNEQSLTSLALQVTGLPSIFRSSSLLNPERISRRKFENRCFEVQIVSGCFMFMRRRDFIRLGGFSTKYFMYGEDADLCLRAAEMGWKLGICSEATLIHLGGQSERIRHDKLTRLIQAKADLIRDHFPKPKAYLALLLLSAWPASRFLAFLILRTVGCRGAEHSMNQWKQVWESRQRWGA